MVSDEAGRIQAEPPTEKRGAAVPNRKTAKAMRELDQRKGERFDDVQALLRDLKL